MLQQFSIFGNQNFIDVKWQKQPPSVLNIFQKFYGKHLDEVDRQYTNHKEQLIDVLDNLYACIFCTKTEFLPF